VALYTLDLFLPSLINEYNGLEISLVHDLSRKITDKVINFEIDLGLVINPTKHLDLVMNKLLDDKVTVWKKSGKVPPVLICHPELLQTQDILKKLRKTDLDIKRVITSNNLEVITKLTMKGSGYGIIPTRVASIFNKNNVIKPVEDAPSFNDELFLIYRIENKNIEYIKVFKEKIKQTF